MSALVDNSHDHNSTEDEEAERQHWLTVMRTMMLYEDFISLEFARRQTHISRLPEALLNRLPNITFNKYSEFTVAMNHNQHFLTEIVQYYASSDLFSDTDSPCVIPDKFDGPKIPYSEQKRNEAVLHSSYREWSKEGAEERSKSFTPIINALKEFLPVTEATAFKKRVLVPGCGMSRLPVEIASNGYSCEGNEFSAFMVMASNFMLNGGVSTGEFKIHPWLDRNCNVVRALDPAKAYSIPDLTAVEIMESGPYHHVTPSPELPRFSFAAGDFMEVYGGENNCGQWDAVVTCFFIDTAPIVLEYIGVIQRILKGGGLWINLGPLLYHWVSDEDNNADPRYDQSVELSWEELRHVIFTYGFDIVREADLSTSYNCCRESMLLSMYRTKFFVAKKIPEATVL